MLLPPPSLLLSSRRRCLAPHPGTFLRWDRPRPTACLSAAGPSERARAETRAVVSDACSAPHLPPTVRQRGAILTVPAPSAASPPRQARMRTRAARHARGMCGSPFPRLHRRPRRLRRRRAQAPRPRPARSAAQTPLAQQEERASLAVGEKPQHGGLRRSLRRVRQKGARTRVFIRHCHPGLSPGPRRPTSLSGALRPRNAGFPIRVNDSTGKIAAPWRSCWIARSQKM